MAIHHFSDTGSAYDACQCNPEIVTGDILVIESERVVGIAWAWPIAVTPENGHLHRVVEGGSISEINEGKFALVAIEAEQIARERGWM